MKTYFGIFDSYAKRVWGVGRKPHTAYSDAMRHARLDVQNDDVLDDDTFNEPVFFCKTITKALYREVKDCGLVSSSEIDGVGCTCAEADAHQAAREAV